MMIVRRAFSVHDARHARGLRLARRPPGAAETVVDRSRRISLRSRSPHHAGGRVVPGLPVLPSVATPFTNDLRRGDNIEEVRIDDLPAAPMSMEAAVFFRSPAEDAMSMDRIPMTRAGYDKLKADLDHLHTVELPKILEGLATARAEGDLSENAEYHGRRRAGG